MLVIFECSKGKRTGEATSLGLLGGARLQKQLDCLVWWTECGRWWDGL